MLALFQADTKKSGSKLPHSTGPPSGRVFPAVRLITILVGLEDSTHPTKEKSTSPSVGLLINLTPRPGKINETPLERESDSGRKHMEIVVDAERVEVELGLREAGPCYFPRFAKKGEIGETKFENRELKNEMFVPSRVA